MRGITFDNENVSAIMDALLNAYSCEKRTGIFSGYSDECDIQTGISYGSSTATVTFKKGAVMICGRVIYIDAGEPLAIPLTATSTGCFGIKVDLSKSVGASEIQYEFFSSLTVVTTQDDLLNNETDGVYYFVIYNYVSDGSAITSTIKTNEMITDLATVLETINASLLLKAEKDASNITKASWVTALNWSPDYTRISSELSMGTYTPASNGYILLYTEGDGVVELYFGATDSGILIGGILHDSATIIPVKEGDGYFLKRSTIDGQAFFIPCSYVEV